MSAAVRMGAAKQCPAEQPDCDFVGEALREAKSRQRAYFLDLSPIWFVALGQPCSPTWLWSACGRDGGTGVHLSTCLHYKTCIFFFSSDAFGVMHGLT